MVETYKDLNKLTQDYDTKDGSCIRDYIHVIDLADGHLKAVKYLDNAKSDKINLGTGVGTSVKEIINLGPDMIHFDGSDLSWEENISLTSQVVNLAHPKGILVEGEPEPDQTDPQRAAEFVQRTGVDLVAVFVGNRHGMDPQKPERLDFERLRAIKQRVGQTFLTLHGGSGVAQEDLKTAIKEQLVAKININTQLRLAYRQELEQQLQNYSGVKVYQLMAPVVDRITQEVLKILNE